MLVLTRKLDEKIRINDDITLSIVCIRGDRVQIGFDAPRSVEIHREEVYQAIQQEKAQPNTEETGNGKVA